MTYNPETHAASIVDILEGTVQEWYDAVDGLLKASDFIPGNYEYAVTVAHTNSTCTEGGQTHVDMVCDRFKFISIDNSYITLEMDYPITKPGFTAASGFTYIKPKAYYIGFKYAFDVLDQYRIYSNSDLIQTQNHANYESFLQYMAVSDVAKENSELYATWDKIQTMNEDVPGVYIINDFADDTTAQVIHVPITIRLPLNAFLLFANLKWYPSFNNKITFELYPSYKNLVVVPVYADVVSTTSKGQTVTALPTMEELAGMISTDLETYGTNLFGFHQINQPIVYAIADRTSAQAANPSATPPVPAIPAHTKTPVMKTFTCNDSTMTKCHIRLAETTIRMDIYNEALARFVNKPMLFPVQTIISKDFGSPLQTGSAEPVSLTMTNALNHCNSMFTVFKKDNNARTVFENPLLESWQVNIDGKYFPREAYKTYNDHRNMNLFLDATNFNGNGLFSVPNDIYHSIQPFVRARKYDAAGSGTETFTCNPKDRSNFAIGIPFCDDDTFQAGIHTGGTVQVELTGKRSDKCYNLYAQAPTALYVEDCILKLRSVKPTGEPQISITHATPEQLLASAVAAN